jgi:hypothetical protein
LWGLPRSKCSGYSSTRFVIFRTLRIFSAVKQFFNNWLSPSIYSNSCS